MSYKVKRNDSGYFDVISPDGGAVLIDESYQVANNVAWRCNQGIHGHSECDEVAAAIVARHGWGGVRS